MPQRCTAPVKPFLEHFILTQSAFMFQTSCCGIYTYLINSWRSYSGFRLYLTSIHSFGHTGLNESLKRGTHNLLRNWKSLNSHAQGELVRMSVNNHLNFILSHTKSNHIAPVD